MQISHTDIVSSMNEAIDKYKQIKQQRNSIDIQLDFDNLTHKEFNETKLAIDRIFNSIVLELNVIIDSFIKIKERKYMSKDEIDDIRKTHTHVNELDVRCQYDKYNSHVLSQPYYTLQDNTDTTYLIKGQCKYEKNVFYKEHTLSPLTLNTESLTMDNDEVLYENHECLKDFIHVDSLNILDTTKYIKKDEAIAYLQELQLKPTIKHDFLTQNNIQSLLNKSYVRYDDQVLHRDVILNHLQTLKLCKFEDIKNINFKPNDKDYIDKMIEMDTSHLCRGTLNFNMLKKYITKAEIEQYVMSKKMYNKQYINMVIPKQVSQRNIIGLAIDHKRKLNKIRTIYNFFNTNGNVLTTTGKTTQIIKHGNIHTKPDASIISSISTLDSMNFGVFKLNPHKLNNVILQVPSIITDKGQVITSLNNTSFTDRYTKTKLNDVLKTYASTRIKVDNINRIDDKNIIKEMPDMSTFVTNDEFDKAMNKVIYDDMDPMINILDSILKTSLKHVDGPITILELSNRFNKRDIKNE